MFRQTGRWIAVAVVMVLVCNVTLAGQTELANTICSVLKNPSKCLGALPQLTANSEPNQAGQEQGNNWGLFRFIVPAGITTLSFLLATLVLGLNIRRNRKVLLPLHKWLGIATVCLAVLHLSLVLLS